jgi:hypothetical protein
MATNDISQNVAAILAWIKTGRATVPVDDKNLGDTLEALVAALSTTSLVQPSTLLAGLTAGTVVASRAVTVDGSRNVATIHSLSMDGTLTLSAAGLYAQGVSSSSVDTAGVTLNASVTKAHGVYADTGGAALTDGISVRASHARFLIGTAISATPNASAFGLEGQLKHIVSDNSGGNEAGIMGHFESQGTLTLTGSINTVRAAVSGFMDLAAGATIAANTVISGLGLHPANFGTKTGRAAAVHITNPVAGNWDSLFDVSGLNGIANAGLSGTQDRWGVIYCDGVKYTFPLTRA